MCEGIGFEERSKGGSSCSNSDLSGFVFSLQRDSFVLGVYRTTTLRCKSGAFVSSPKYSTGRARAKVSVSRPDKVKAQGGRTAVGMFVMISFMFQVLISTLITPPVSRYLPLDCLAFIVTMTLSNHGTVDI